MVDLFLPNLRKSGFNYVDIVKRYQTLINEKIFDLY
jgi:hypothetical protein